MSISNLERSDDPNHWLTTICGETINLLDASPDNEHVRCIVLLKTPEGQAGLGHRGFEDDMEAVNDLLVHLEAILQANGKTLLTLTLP